MHQRASRIFDRLQLNHISKTNIHHVFVDALCYRLHRKQILKTQIYQVVVKVSG